MHEQIGLSPVNEMLYIKQLRPRLNVQTNSILAEVFVWLFFTYANLEDFMSFMNSHVHFQLTDNGVMRWPRRRKFNITSLVFIYPYFSKSLIIIIIIIY